MGSRQASPVSSAYAGEAQRGRLGSHSGSPNLVGSVGSSQSCLGSASISSRISRADEITESWMNNVAEWARRSSNGSQSVGSQSRCNSGRVSPRSGGVDTGPPSRASSPEDATRGSATLSVDIADGQRMGLSHDEAPYAAAGDFRMVGMPSDDEKENTPKEEDEEDEATAGIEIGTDAVSSSRRSSLEETPPPDRRLSPLIAMLNPFLSPPPLELPEAEEVDEEGRGPEDIGETCGVVFDGLEDASDAHPLFSDMRDLIYRMQKCQLSLAFKEVGMEEMLARLSHFREFASEQ